MTPAPILKVCGITRLADAQHAVDKGATAIGFVFWSRSPRAIEPERAREIVAALPATVTTVGVFVNEPVAGIRLVIDRTGIQMVQLHGDEGPHYAMAIERPILRAVSLDGAAETSRLWPAETTLLLDASDPVRRGGTGVPIDWARASSLARRHRIVLAGGLTPLNVEEAVRTVRPSGVDVSSGVESTPGIKDAEKVTRFLANAQRAFSFVSVRTV